MFKNNTNRQYRTIVDIELEKIQIIATIQLKNQAKNSKSKINSWLNLRKSKKMEKKQYLFLHNHLNIHRKCHF